MIDGSKEVTGTYRHGSMKLMLGHPGSDSDWYTVDGGKLKGFTKEQLFLYNIEGLFAQVFENAILLIISTLIDVL